MLNTYTDCQLLSVSNLEYSLLGLCIALHLLQQSASCHSNSIHLREVLCLQQLPPACTITRRLVYAMSLPMLLLCESQLCVCGMEKESPGKAFSGTVAQSSDNKHLLSKVRRQLYGLIIWKRNKESGNKVIKRFALLFKLLSGSYTPIRD